MNDTADIQDNEKIITDTGQEFSLEEIRHSKRIQKSATPKGTLDWYIKWAASVCLIVAAAFRSAGIPDLHVYDMILSFCGILGWATVGFIWKDRALVILNAVMGAMLFSGLIKIWFGH